MGNCVSCGVEISHRNDLCHACFMKQRGETSTPKKAKKEKIEEEEQASSEGA